MPVTETTVLISSVRIFRGMHQYEKEKMQHISYRLKYHMAEYRISQPELAQVCGCSIDTIFSYANGKCREENMDIGILKKIEAYFGKEEYYFCNEYLKFIDTVNVPEWLKRKRKERNMLQREFAAKLHIPLNNYKAYEAGIIRLQFRYWKEIENFLTDE